MVMKEHWLELILSRRKVLEIRGCNRLPGVYFLGRKHVLDGVASHQIHGVATTLPAERIPSLERFAALLPLHQCEVDHMPYANTWALPLRDVRRIDPPIPYVHHRGSIGWCRFEPIAGEEGRAAVQPLAMVMKRPAADRPGQRTAACVAMKRVKKDEDYLFSEQYMKKHFVPNA